MPDKKTKILESALSLFVERGIQSTPTAIIAKQAGVSNGTLFHYYDTKDMLIRDLYHAVIKNLDQAILYNIDLSKGAKDGINGMWENWINWAMKYKNKYFFLRQFETSGFQISNTTILSQTKKQFVAIVEQGIRQNIIGFFPADFIYELFEANVHGMILYFGKNQVKYRTPEFFRQSYEHYWNSLKNHSNLSVLN